MKPSISVLVAERDPMLMSIEREFIERTEGFTVCGTVTSLNSLEQFLRFSPYSPDLVILEPFLPFNSIRKAMGMIQSRERHSEIIVVSLCSETSVVVEACLYGIFDYIVKPFSFERLRQSLMNFTDHLSLRHALPQNMSQEDIDRFFRRQSSAMTDLFRDLPKNLVRETAIHILKVIHRMKQTLSVAEIARHTGLSKTTVWRYLHFLYETGFVGRREDYGTTGRPVIRYFPLVRNEKGFPFSRTE